MARQAPRFGLGLLTRALCTATLAATGAGTRDSAYTQDGPGPGTPVVEDGSTWRPRIAEAQSQGLTLATIRGGYAGRDGAQVVYRLEDDEDDEDYRSWQEPVLITGWHSPVDAWGASQTWDAFTATVIRETGVIVIVAVDTATNDAQTWSYDPRTREFETLYDWDSGAADGLVLPVGLAYDAERSRVLLWSGYANHGARQQTAYQSLDGGTTWTLYSRGYALGSADDSGVGAGTYPTTGSFYPVPGDDLDWLLIVNEDLSDLTAASAANGVHLASSDGGIRWDLVTDTTVAGIVGQPLKGPAGFALVGLDTNDSKHLKCFLAAHARARFETEVVIDDSRSYSGAWACTDYDGTLYVVARGATGGVSFGRFYAFRSTDGGLTWTAYGWGVLSTASATHTLDPRCLVASQGQLHLIGTCAGSATTDHTLQVVSLGGWSQVAHGSGTTQAVRDPSHRFGYGVVDSLAINGWTACYLPLGLPDNLGWTASGATGTPDLTDTVPGLHLSTTAGQAVDYFISGGTTAAYMAADLELRLHATGNVDLATLGAAGGGVYLSLTLSSGAYYYEARLDIGSDGIQIVDTNLAGSPAIRGSVSFDTSVEFFRVRVELAKGNVTAWASLDGVIWQRFVNGATVTNAPAFAAGADLIYFGIQSTQIGNCHIRFIGCGAGVDWQYGIDGTNQVGDAPNDGPLGHSFGKAVPPPATPYPIPEGTAEGESLALLSATGGPTTMREVVELPVAYSHGIQNVDPIVSPSPRQTWRATDDSAVELVWDQGEDEEMWTGGATGLVVVGTPRFWVLAQDDGSSGWDTLGTLDLAEAEDLLWVRVGRYVIPDTGTDSIDRRFAENELKGGTFDLDGVCRRILSNSGGFWTDDASVQQIRIELEGLDGSEPDGGSAGVLCAPGAVLVAHRADETPRRYLRARAAANQAVPGDVYEAGCVAPFRVVGLSDPEWTWSATTGLVRRFSVASDGTTTATELGPAGRLLAYSWGRSPLGEAQSLAVAPDPIQGTAPSSPIGSALNAPMDLPGLLEETESGAIPVVVLPRTPSETASTTNRRLWLLGRVSSGALTVQGTSGAEGLNEFVTGPSLGVQELR